MKLFIVIGKIWNEDTDILGVYDSEELAIDRMNESSQGFYGYDDVTIKEVLLNESIDVYD